MDVEVYIPSYKRMNVEHEKSFTVFCVEVHHAGRMHIVERRYTDFEELHKKLRHTLVTPAFPPKTVMKWSGKVLETRRLAFENYLQMVLSSPRVPRSLLTFLDLPALTHSNSLDSLDMLDGGVTHQPVLVFAENTFLTDNQKGSLPDIVATGVTQGLYGSADDLR